MVFCQVILEGVEVLLKIAISVFTAYISLTFTLILSTPNYQVEAIEMMQFVFSHFRLAIFLIGIHIIANESSAVF